MQIIQESDNLYRLTRFGIINCFLLKAEDGCCLIDTNVWGSAMPISLLSQKLRLPIRRIFLTHAHFDHVASLDELVATLPGVEVLTSAREARFLAGDFSLDIDERGKKLFGFLPVKAKVTRQLNDGEQVGCLRAISSPGHTPGHLAYLDVRDNTLIAGDSFTTHTGLVAAGVFKLTFPFPALFSWNAELCARSAKKLAELRPSRLAVGHGKTLVSPEVAMDQAIALALQRHPGAGTA